MASLVPPLSELQIHYYLDNVTETLAGERTKNAAAGQWKPTCRSRRKWLSSSSSSVRYRFKEVSEPSPRLPVRKGNTQVVVHKPRVRVQTIVATRGILSFDDIHEHRGERSCKTNREPYRRLQCPERLVRFSPLALFSPRVRRLIRRCSLSLLLLVSSLSFPHIPSLSVSSLRHRPIGRGGQTGHEAHGFIFV